MPNLLGNVANMIHPENKIVNDLIFLNHKDEDENEKSKNTRRPTKRVADRKKSAEKTKNKVIGR